MGRVRFNHRMDTAAEGANDRGTTQGRVVGRLAVASLAVLLAAGCTVTRPDVGSAPTHPVSADLATTVPFTWPLTAADGTIYCPGHGVLVIEVDGHKYALNASAKTAGYVNIDAVCADDPHVAGAKIDLQGLTDYASTACGY